MTQENQNGGRREGDVNRGPREIMQELGIDAADWQSPLEFLLAVMNGDKRIEKETGKNPTINQRIECARIAAPYLHKKQPTMILSKVAHSWAEATKEAEERLSSMRKPYEPDSGRVH